MTDEQVQSLDWDKAEEIVRKTLGHVEYTSIGAAHYAQVLLLISTRLATAEQVVKAHEPLRLQVAGFIDEVSLCRRQRDARGTGAIGAGLPGQALSYIQPSALSELVRTARQMEIAMNAVNAALDAAEGAGG